MRVTVEGQRLELKPADVVGQGGEAVVYRKGTRAIKIFQSLGQDALARKAAKLAQYPRTLPPPVLAPLAIAQDDKGDFVGYAMRFLAGGLDGQKLTSKKQREGVLDAAGATRWLIALGQALEAVHAAGVVVGDLNDGNVLYAAGAPYLIDADSYQFAGHPCTVAHEKYLDPRLYGVDLEKSAALSVETDWYAYAVLTFSVLLLVHPYGGTHPSIGTLARRAAARVSVLRPEVTRPKVSLAPGVLPAALTQWFGAVFDGGLRERLPEGLLAALAWTKCACGLEHARAACPACAQRGVVQPRPAIVHHGRVRWIPLAELPVGPPLPAYRLEGDHLVEARDGTRVGSILEGATVIRVGRALGAGYYRAGRLTHHFLFRAGRPGLVPLALPTIEGRLVDHAVVFDEGHALIAWQQEVSGRTTAHLHLVDARGAVIASRVGPPESSPLLTGVSGFALLGGRALRATEAGIQVVEADAGALVAGALFTDTEPFVAEGCEILPGPAGSLYVVHGTAVGQLCLA